MLIYKWLKSKRINLQTNQKSTIELFCENDYQLKKLLFTQKLHLHARLLTVIFDQIYFLEVYITRKFWNNEFLWCERKFRFNAITKKLVFRCFALTMTHVEKSLKFVISCLLETSFSKILPEKHTSNVFRKKAVQIFDRYLNTQTQSPGRVI